MERAAGREKEGKTEDGVEGAGKEGEKARQRVEGVEGGVPRQAFPPRGRRYRRGRARAGAGNPTRANCGSGFPGADAEDNHLQGRGL